MHPRYFCIVRALIGCGIVALLVGCGRDLSGFQHLKDPRITTLPRQKVLSVELTGRPDDIAGKGIGALYGTFYKLKRHNPGVKVSPAPPRARWPKPLDTPVDEWIGIFGIPVPEKVTQLPPPRKDSDLEIGLVHWEYGEVAEILHVGTYASEDASFRRLEEHVSAQGYEKIPGTHEEVYLKGPGWIFRGKPEKYQTILRYRVKRPEPTVQGVPDSLVASAG